MQVRLFKDNANYKRCYIIKDHELTREIDLLFLHFWSKPKPN